MRLSTDRCFFMVGAKCGAKLWIFSICVKSEYCCAGFFYDRVGSAYIRKGGPIGVKEISFIFTGMKPNLSNRLLFLGMSSIYFLFLGYEVLHSDYLFTDEAQAMAEY
jgi:hypothetical protein